MIIVHVIIGLNVGGAELMLKRLVLSKIHGKNYQYAVISLTDIGVVGRQLQQSGINVQALGLTGIWDAWRVFRDLLYIIKKLKPDIVQTWMYHADLIGGLAARFSGVNNIIWGVRTTDLNAAGFSGTVLVRKICSWLSRYVPRFIVCAAEESRKVHESVGYDDSRMVVIPNGFDLDRFVHLPKQRTTLRKQLRFEEEFLLVGYVGRFHAVKDQANFVRASGIVASMFPNVRFMMVGRELDLTNVQLRNWIEETRYADRFVLMGERSDIPECLASMDLFCLSSRTEGFPNAVGEAMAMCLPCVVTDVGDAAMMVGDAGVVVPKEDSTALADGLCRLLALTTEQRSQLGQKARARIHNEFSMDRASERFAALYTQMIRKGPN